MDSYEIVYIICSVLAFIPAIVFHEWMHGWAAYKLGDTTAKAHGRLSFNPVKHVDLFGTVILPLLLMFMNWPVFGYAKPVPYNPSNFKDPRKGDLIVGLAGPCANLILALLGSVLMFVLQGMYAVTTSVVFMYFYAMFLPLFILINLYLMFFNLLPIPPLDGSSIFAFFMPEKYLPTYYKIQSYALPVLMIILIVLPYVSGFNLFSWYLNVTAGNVAALLIP